MPKRFLAQQPGLWSMHGRISQRLHSYLVTRPNSLPAVVGLDNTVFGCQFGICRMGSGITQFHNKFIPMTKSPLIVEDNILTQSSKAYPDYF